MSYLTIGSQPRFCLTDVKLISDRQEVQGSIGPDDMRTASNLADKVCDDLKIEADEITICIFPAQEHKSTLWSCLCCCFYTLSCGGFKDWMNYETYRATVQYRKEDTDLSHQFTDEKLKRLVSSVVFDGSTCCRPNPFLKERSIKLVFKLGGDVWR